MIDPLKLHQNFVDFQKLYKHSISNNLFLIKIKLIWPINGEFMAID